MRLKRIRADALTIRRLRRGKGFSYVDGDGRPIRDAAALARIRSLAIPPAYEEVRIAADPRSHLQATGRDEAGRIQHRYHPEWEKVRERRKLKRLQRLIEALPGLREEVARDLAARSLCQAKALGCAVAIMDRCHIRVGSEAYARANGSYGAATLLKRHVTIAGASVELRFRGKSSKPIALAIRDAPLARALSRLSALPGKRLLQWRDEDGNVTAVTAAQINAYLRRITGLPISSKDLRMLAANAAAAELLLAGDVAASKSGEKRQVADVMRVIAQQLANTPAVVRKSYVHELVISSYASGRLKASYARARRRAGCSRIEHALALLAT